MQNLRIQQGRTLPSAGRWLRVHGTLCSGHTHPALGGDATDTRQTRTSLGAAAACLAVSLTGGEGRRPERPAAVAEPQVAMEPGVLPQVPHDNRAVRGPRKQQEGLAGAQAAARDLGGHTELSVPTASPPASRRAARVCALASSHGVHPDTPPRLPIYNPGRRKLSSRPRN